MNELKITKERVLEAASKCTDAKRTLETLFPEAFGDKSFIPKKIYAMQGYSQKYKLHEFSSLKNEYAWVSLENSTALAESIGTREGRLKYARENRKLFVFDNVKDFAKWILE